MRRGASGTYRTTAIGGEAVRAFVPAALPPVPPIVIGGDVQVRLEAAGAALGQLDAAATLLPDRALFLYAYVRKEAVLSSQIEGTQSSLSDLMLFELDGAPGAPIDDVVEVSNYVAALEHGVARLRGGFPLSSRLLRELHGILLSRGRGSAKDPGEFRRSQNWIGGTRPGNAVFVPPPVEELASCVTALEQFLHAPREPLPVLVRAALVHVQFETIHPFLDGNGRVGRLLIPLMLFDAGLLREPLLYLSLYLKHHRRTYYDLLDAVRRDGDWEAWIEFFLDGVREVALAAVSTAGRLAELFRDDQARASQSGRRAGSVVRVLEALKSRPVRSLRAVCESTGLTFPTAAAAMRVLVENGVARELTGGRRNRVFLYDRYLALLGEGIDPV